MSDTKGANRHNYRSHFALARNDVIICLLTSHGVIQFAANPGLGQYSYGQAEFFRGELKDRYLE